MSLASLSIRRPTFVGALVAVMLVVGGFCFLRLGVDQFPDVDFPFILVTTPYRGAGPKEVETLVSKPLEEEISSIAGIKHLSSVSMDNVSVVSVEFGLGTDIKYAEQQVRDKVALARPNLPKEIDEPTLKRMGSSDMPILRLALKADLKPAEIYDLAHDKVKPDLEQVENVAQVVISGGTKREIRVNLDRDKLKARELSLTSVANRIALGNQNVPVGKTQKDGLEMLYRTMGEYRDLDQLRHAAVNFFGSDRAVTVADLGTVEDTLEEPTTFAYFGGKPAVFLDVFRQSGANTVAVATGLKKRISKLQDMLKGAPGHPELVLVRDNAKSVDMNIKDVRQTILIGIVLVVIVVYFFLGSGRSTLITTAALPNSLIGSFILMYLMGFTINMITLMALSMAVGLLIDDAIVVRENIWRHLAMGKSPEKAALDGTHEVTLAVVATTATVIAVFLPVGFLSGISGQFLKSLGWTIIFAMAISLFDAMTMAPLLSCYLAAKTEKAKERFNPAHWSYANPLHWLRLAVGYFEQFQEWLSLKYEGAIRWCLSNRGKVALMALAIFAGSLMLISRVPTTFMESQDLGFFQVTMEGKPGTSLEGMRDEALKLDAQIRSHKEMDKVALVVGNDNGEPNVANFYIELVDGSKRSINTTDMKELLRKEMAPFRDFNPKVGDVPMFGNGAAFNLLMSADDLDTLARVSAQAKEAIKGVQGLTEVDTNFRPGKPESQVVMDPLRMKELGVSSVVSGMELRGMIDGVVPAKFRTGDDEYDIRVRLKEDQRDLGRDFDKAFIPNMNYNLVRLKDVAGLNVTEGPQKINRRDRQRDVWITAEIAKGGHLGNAQADAHAVMEKLNLPPGVVYSFVGMSEDMTELFTSMVQAMGLALIFIYLVLASLYESLLMPFLIMVAVPLAIVGAFVSLYLTQFTGNPQSLNLFSMIGLIMLMGLVVKNSILLVDYTMQLTRRGMPRREAIVLAGRTRLRPILMTSISLIMGMLPLALALSEVGRFRQAMGIAIIGGLVSSTAMTLLVIPSLYEWADDFRLWTRKIFRRPALRKLEVEELTQYKTERKKGKG